MNKTQKIVFDILQVEMQKLLIQVKKYYDGDVPRYKNFLEKMFFAKNADINQQINTLTLYLGVFMNSVYFVEMRSRYHDADLVHSEVGLKMIIRILSFIAVFSVVLDEKVIITSFSKPARLGEPAKSFYKIMADFYDHLAGYLLEKNKQFYGNRKQSDNSKIVGDRLLGVIKDTLDQLKIYIVYHQCQIPWDEVDNILSDHIWTMKTK
jgi:hypothetical protein